MYHTNLKTDIMKNLKNPTLKRDIMESLINVSSAKKNEYNQAERFSIDIEESEPLSVSSYVYTTESERDADLAILQELIKQKENEEKTN